MVAAASILVSLGVVDSLRKSKLQCSEARKTLVRLAMCEPKELVSLSKMILFLLQNIDTQLSGLSQVRSAYMPILARFNFN